MYLLLVIKFITSHGSDGSIIFSIVDKFSLLTR